MLDFRSYRGGQKRYHARTTCTISCEAELLERVKDLAAEQRYTISEIVNTAFVEFLKKNTNNITTSLK